MTKTRITLPLLALVSAIPSVVQAANWQWNVAGPADWNDPANWAADGGVDNDRFVNNGGTATITADTNQIVRDIKIGMGGVGTVNQTAGVASTGAGNWAFVGVGAGSTGTYNLSGGSFIGSGRMIISDGGTAILNVSGSGTASTGGEFWVGNGGGGSGTVNQTGGTVTANDWLAIGRSGGTGVYNLSAGTLSHTGVNQTIIGSLDGNGTLNQTGGTFSVVNDLRLGENSAAQGKYNLSGGTASVNGWTIVGWTGGGTGEVNVSGNGYLNTGYVEVGGGAGGAGNGTVNMNGGVIETRIISRNGGAISGQLNFNGGTFKAKENNAEILPGFSTATTEVLAGGLKVDTNGFDIATGVALDGVGGLTKSGAGTLTLNGASTYSGVTKVVAGTLKLGATGSLNPSSVIDVAAGATFDGSATSGIVVPAAQTVEGNGTVKGNMTVNGTLAPGNSIGTLTIDGNLTLTGTSDFELDASAPSADLAIVTGTLTFGGTLNVSLLTGTLVNGQTFNLFDGTSTGTFSAVNLPGGSSMWLNNLYTDGTITYVPEPGSLSLLGLGVAALLRRRRRA